MAYDGSNGDATVDLALSVGVLYREEHGLQLDNIANCIPLKDLGVDSATYPNLLANPMAFIEVSL